MMATRMRHALRLAKLWLNPSGHRIVTFEQTRFCNRRCAYCQVPLLYDKEAELSVKESRQVIDRLIQWRFPILSYVGGEPLADQSTKEGISVFEHTVQVLRYASRYGMYISLTSNGDYVTEDKLEKLHSAGLSHLALSLHTYKRDALDDLVDKAQRVKAYGMIPSILTVFTAPRTQLLPGIAAHIVKKGVIFGTAICQDYGGPFSPKCTELVPTPKQQRYVLGALLYLYPSGLVRMSRSYLREAPRYYPNKWKCNAQNDAYLHIGPDGKLNVCVDVRTDIHINEAQSLSDERWRHQKQDLVSKCHGCLLQCMYELHNPDIIGDIPTYLAGLLIFLRQSSIVQRWGALWVQKAKAASPDIDWVLHLK